MTNNIMNIKYRIESLKEELEGQWKAQYNRTSDDFEIKNKDSRVLYEMITLLVEELDRQVLESNES